MKKVTVKDIAALAGVSRGTVDRVLNNRGRVAEETREIVCKVANQLGYKKNVIASSLASSKVVDIAVVFPIPRKGSFWNYPMHGLQEGIDLYGHYGINLRYFNFTVDDKNSFENKIEEAIQEKPSAILIAPLFLKETLKYLQLTSQNEIPVFTLNTEINHPDIINYVGQNSYSCGKIAGRLFYLANKEIEKIFCITPGHSKENVQHTRDKIDGLNKFFDEMDKRVTIEEVNVKNFNKISAFTALHPLFAEDDIGLFVTNSRMHHFLKGLGKGTLKGNNILIGFDLVPNNLVYLEEGKIDFLLDQNPRIQAKKALENIVHYLLFEKEIDRTNYIPTDIILKENYRFYLD